MKLKFWKRTPASAGKGGGKKPKRSRRFMLRREAGFVMFIGDEGAVLIRITRGKVRQRLFAADTSDDNIKPFREALAEEPKADIVLLADTIDQTYVRQTLPPVSSMSVQKLIRRRLEREFQGSDIKGAIVLGRSKEGRKDWNFLMAGLDRSQAVAMWVDFVETLPNPFLGIYLVPVEAEILVRELSHVLEVPMSGEGASQWQFLVSYNKVGGVRQVIFKEGRMVFTRVGQPVGELTPEVIAGNIEQEVQSTVEYMKRLSYQPQDGLDLFLIAAAEVNAMIDASKLKASNLWKFTPHEAAELLKIEGATQPMDKFGDVLLASVLGGGRKHVMKLLTPLLKSVDKWIRIRATQRVACAILAVALLGYTATLLVDMVQNRQQAEDVEYSLRQSTQLLDSLRAQAPKAPDQVDKIIDMVDVYQAMNTQAVSPISYITRLSQSLPEEVRVTSIEWKIDGSPAVAAPTGAAASAPLPRVGGHRGVAASAPAAPPPPPAPAAAPAAEAMPPIPANATPEQIAEYNKKMAEYQAGKAAAPTGERVVITLNVEFLANTTDAKRFVAYAKQFFQKLQAQFPGYTLQYSKLPGEVSESESVEVSLDEKGNVKKSEFDGKPVAVSLTMTGPVTIPVSTVADVKEGRL